MNQLPASNNVFGYLFSKTSLEKVAEVLKTRIGLTKTEVYVKRNKFDRHEIMYIRTKEYEFEIQKLREDNTWSFNGAVAGNLDEILTILKTIYSNLIWADYQTKFEIYDDKFDFIAEYPEK
jgi:hypothetical protein